VSCAERWNNNRVLCTLPILKSMQLPDLRNVAEVKTIT
jgi:hypothetical protein